MYETYLAARRTQPLTIVEIGVWRGASLRTWRDYFPAARIFGIDIDPAAAQHADDRIEVLIGSQADEAFLNGVVERTGPPDVVLDDGSHLAAHQLATLQVLWPKLKEGGLYVVEDTQTSYHPGYEMGWRMPGSTIEILKDFVDDVHHGAHGGPIGLEGVEFVHFYHGTCVLKKRVSPAKPTFTQLLDGASARASGAWTG